ncbi:MAG: hypothetical protein KC423_02380 [Anaerolineales bacterium]|nr:hypothetical protein [Anaerolineales bacterium]
MQMQRYMLDGLHQVGFQMYSKAIIVDIVKSLEAKAKKKIAAIRQLEQPLDKANQTKLAQAETYMANGRFAAAIALCDQIIQDTSS